MFPLGSWNLYSKLWFIKNSHVIECSTPGNLVNPIFYRKSVPYDHLKKSILPWMFTFPSVKCFIRSNPRYRKWLVQ